MGAPLLHERRPHSNQINDRACNVSAERIKSWPTKERPRERLLAEGPERLTDADLLAIILRVGLGTFKEGVPGKIKIAAGLRQDDLPNKQRGDQQDQNTT